jgi:hypothetical protein
MLTVGKGDQIMAQSQRKTGKKGMTKSSKRASNVASKRKKSTARKPRAPAATKRTRGAMTKSSEKSPRPRRQLEPSAFQRLPITKPNIYFLVYVFNKKDLPKPPDAEILTIPTFHFREYVQATDVTPLTARAWDRIGDMATIGYANDDETGDSPESSDYEFRLVDLSNIEDVNPQAIEQRRKQLPKEYEKALHWRLFCVTVRVGI